jgi:hypothetical protein
MKSANDFPKIVIILTVKPGFLPKTDQSYANIEVVWLYNENEAMANRVDVELSEITDNDEEASHDKEEEDE